MVREIAVFQAQEGRTEAFVEAPGGVANILNEAEGSRGASLHRGVEDPDSYTLLVEWASTEAHTALTHRRPQFESFQEGIGPYLAGQPEVRDVKAVG